MGHLTESLLKLDELPRPLSGSMSALNDTLERWIGFGGEIKDFLVEAVAKSVVLTGKIEGDGATPTT